MLCWNCNWNDLNVWTLRYKFFRELIKRSPLTMYKRPQRRHLSTAGWCCRYDWVMTDCGCDVWTGSVICKTVNGIVCCEHFGEFHTYSLLVFENKETHSSNWYSIPQQYPEKHKSISVWVVWSLFERYNIINFMKLIRVSSHNHKLQVCSKVQHDTPCRKPGNVRY